MSTEYQWPYSDPEPRAQRARVVLVSPAGTVSAVELDDDTVPVLEIYGDRYERRIYQPADSPSGFTLYSALSPLPQYVEKRIDAICRIVNNDSRWPSNH